MRPPALTIGTGFAVIVSILLTGCDRLTHQSSGADKAETKRQRTACASAAAYDRLKNSIFDEAIAKSSADRSNLDTLADYSVARMENPVVKAWDQSLDITRCKGRLILEVPPGAERGLGGARQLQADIEYTAQASADGSGLVYQQRGADAIVAKLAAFNLGAAAYRPPPAIDPGQPASNGSEQPSVQQAEVAEPGARAAVESTQLPEQQPKPTLGPPQRPGERALSSPMPPRETSGHTPSGEQAVRGFYAAIGAGNGAAAASHVIPEKRSSGPFSAGAISRFYGHLPEPLRLTSITPEGNAYRVTYRYSAGRSRCNGVAVVRVANRGGRVLISSIRSLTGC